jgi:hypothetical protein
MKRHTELFWPWNYPAWRAFKINIPIATLTKTNIFDTIKAINTTVQHSA